MERSYCKVLIIDDEFIMRQGIKHMIEWEKEGYRIVGEASNGEEGLKMIEKFQPDIVLLDIIMPVINGMEFSAIMKKRFPQIRLIILSSFDRFEYVKETLLNGAVDYVLKPSLNPEIMLQVLEKTVKTIPNLQLKKDVELSVQEKLSRRLCGYESFIPESSFTKEFPHTQFHLLCSNQRILCNGYRETENDIYDRINSFFTEKIKFCVKTLRINEEICCIVINYQIKEEEELLHTIEHCIDKIRIYQPDTFWVLSTLFSGQNDLVQVYNSTVEKLSLRFYYKNRPLVYEEQIPEMKREKKFEYEKYAGCLKYQEFGKALDQLAAHIEVECEEYVEEYLLKNLTKNMIYNFIVEWEKVDNKLSGRKTKYFRKLDSCIYVQDFLDAFHGIIEELRAESEKIVAGDIGNIGEICEYIREHYNENLELVQIAKQFNYNYNYLSTYFNHQVQEGFSEYLNRVRIEKACEMLRASQLSIADVSAMIGYSDHSYFCRVFKNMKGRTPSEWRRIAHLSIK